MSPQVLTGTKQEIAESLFRIKGEVREAIVFVEEAASATPEASASDTTDIFAEMRPFMVNVQDVDDSRETIYSRVDGE